jgi:hypothetical protein
MENGTPKNSTVEVAHAVVEKHASPSDLVVSTAVRYNGESANERPDIGPSEI